MQVLVLDRSIRFQEAQKCKLGLKARESVVEECYWSSKAWMRKITLRGEQARRI